MKDQQLKLAVDGIKDSISAKVDFVEPALRPDQSFIPARVYLDNRDMNLKIGAIVRANIRSSNEKGNFLPSTAIINLGKRSVVFVMKDKLFEAREIITGLKSDGWVQVISGLNKDELVAENSQLLIDSEAFVRTEQR